MATKYNLINCRYYITKTRWLSFTYNVPGYGQLKSVLSNYVCLWYRTPKLVRHGLHELFWLKRLLTICQILSHNSPGREKKMTIIVLVT